MYIKLEKPEKGKQEKYLQKLYDRLSDDKERETLMEICKRVYKTIPVDMFTSFVEPESRRYLTDPDPDVRMAAGMQVVKDLGRQEICCGTPVIQPMSQTDDHGDGKMEMIIPVTYIDPKDNILLAFQDDMERRLEMRHPSVGRITYKFDYGGEYVSEHVKDKYRTLSALYHGEVVLDVGERAEETGKLVRRVEAKMMDGKAADLPGVLKRDDVIAPPWLVYPKASPFEINWRMGSGEDTISDYGRWYETLSEEEQREYDFCYPPSPTWEPWVAKTLDGIEWCYWGEMDRNEYTTIWRKDGKPIYTKEKLAELLQADHGHEILTISSAESDDGMKDVLCLEYPIHVYMDEPDIRYYESVLAVLIRKKLQVSSLSDWSEEYNAILEGHDREVLRAVPLDTEKQRQVWEEVRYTVMLNAIFCKFHVHPALRNYLISTGDSILVDADPDDRLLGAGLAADDPCIQDPASWPGENLHGLALMEVRDRLREIWRYSDQCSDAHWIE